MKKLLVALSLIVAPASAGQFAVLDSSNNIVATVFLPVTSLVGLTFVPIAAPAPLPVQPRRGWHRNPDGTFTAPSKPGAKKS